MATAYIRNGKLLVTSDRKRLLSECPCIMVRASFDFNYSSDGIKGLKYTWSLPTLTYSSPEQNPASALSLSGRGTHNVMTPPHWCCDIDGQANGQIIDWGSHSGTGWNYIFGGVEYVDRAGSGRFEIDGRYLSESDDEDTGRSGGTASATFRADVQIGESHPSPCPVTATVAFSHRIGSGAWTTESSRLVVSGTDTDGSRSWTNNYNVTWSWSPRGFSAPNMWTGIRYDIAITRN